MITERDRKNLKLTEQIAKIFSKDPSTKVGAYIVDKDNRPISIGYNGFPRGVKDTAERLGEREIKYAFTVHAEANALLHARGTDLGACTLYVWPLECCSSCAALVVNSGIKRVVTLPSSPEQKERWGKSFETTKIMFEEANVEIVYVDSD